MLNVRDECVCRTQGEIFQLVAEKGYDMVDFIYDYMETHFANKEMGAIYSFYHMADAEECLDYLDRYDFEYKKYSEDSGHLEIDPINAYWFGYTYRELCLIFKISSSELIKKVRIEDLIKLQYIAQNEDEEYFYSLIEKKLNS